MNVMLELAAALDPAQLFAMAVGHEPDPWQARVLRSPAPRVLLNCSRQSGKSTVVAALAIHTALFQAGALVLLLSPSLRQSGELFRKLIGFYHALDHPVAPQQKTALQLQLANGSRVVSLPGQEGTIRGFSGVALLIVDEASRVPDELYRAVRPMLAVSGGRLVALSTPFGKRGWFFEEWQNGGPAWGRVQVTAHECPRIAREFLVEEERALGPRWFAQEYLCSFEETAGGVFSAADVAAALSDEVKPLWS